MFYLISALGNTRMNFTFGVYLCKILLKLQLLAPSFKTTHATIKHAIHVTVNRYNEC